MSAERSQAQSDSTAAGTGLCFQLGKHHAAGRALAGPALTGACTPARVGSATQGSCNEQNDLVVYRRSRIHWRDNRALAAAAEFRGDALVVEAENDEILPRQVIENFVAAFRQPRSLTARKLSGADHGLTGKRPSRPTTTPCWSSGRPK